MQIVVEAWSLYDFNAAASVWCLRATLHVRVLLLWRKSVGDIRAALFGWLLSRRLWKGTP